MFCKHLMLGSLALMLSLWMHPTFAGVLAYLGGAGLLEWFIGWVPPLKVLYAILPSYNRFNLVNEVMSGTLIDPPAIGMLTLYAFDFIAIMVLLAFWRFRSMDVVKE